MTKTLVRACDDAYQSFRALSEKLMLELAVHRALIDDFDTIAERQVRAVNTGLAFMLEAAAAYTEATTGKTVSQLLAERDLPAPGSSEPGSMVQ